MPFDLRVAPWMWVLSQTVGAISLIWWFLIYQQKDKEKTLWMSSVGKLLGILSNALLLNFVMTGLLAVRVPRDMTFAYLERRNKRGRPVCKRLSLSLFFLFCALSIIITILTWERFWFNWILLAGALFVNFGKWKKGRKIFWTSVIIWSVLAFINALIFLNVTTMITCAVILISLTITITRTAQEKKEPYIKKGEQMTNEIKIVPCIKKRRSIRKFNPNGVVTDGQIKTMLEAAMLAPSAVNSRPWEFIIVKNRQKLDEITAKHPYAQMLKTTSLAIIMTANPKALERVRMSGIEMWQHDCGAAAQNILLQAAEMDLGTCWCGIHPNEDRMDAFRKLFDISEDRVPFCVIAVGIAAEEFGSRGFYDEKKVKWVN